MIGWAKIKILGEIWEREKTQTAAGKSRHGGYGSEIKITNFKT